MPLVNMVSVSFYACGWNAKTWTCRKPCSNQTRKGKALLQTQNFLFTILCLLECLLISPCLNLEPLAVNLNFEARCFVDWKLLSKYKQVCLVPCQTETIRNDGVCIAKCMHFVKLFSFTILRANSQQIAKAVLTGNASD